MWSEKPVKKTAKKRKTSRSGKYDKSDARKVVAAHKAKRKAAKNGGE